MPEESEALVNELRTRVERLELLLMIGRMMHATSDQEELINSIAMAVGHYLDADRCSIFFHDKVTDELYSISPYGATVTPTKRFFRWRASKFGSRVTKGSPGTYSRLPKS